jgi:hypothetical protein
LLLLVLGAVSCAQILGDDFQIEDDDEGSSSSGGDCDANALDCGECLDCACVNEVEACYANVECDSLLECIAFCASTEECNSCYASYPGGVDGVNAVLNCGYASCPTTCGGA